MLIRIWEGQLTIWRLQVILGKTMAWVGSREHPRVSIVQGLPLLRLTTHCLFLPRLLLIVPSIHLIPQTPDVYLRKIGTPQTQLTLSVTGTSPQRASYLGFRVQSGLGAYEVCSQVPLVDGLFISSLLILETPVSLM